MLNCRCSTEAADTNGDWYIYTRHARRGMRARPCSTTRPGGDAWIIQKVGLWRLRAARAGHVRPRQPSHMRARGVRLQRRIIKTSEERGAPVRRSCRQGRCVVLPKRGGGDVVRVPDEACPGAKGYTGVPCLLAFLSCPCPRLQQPGPRWCLLATIGSPAFREGIWLEMDSDIWVHRQSKQDAGRDAAVHCASSYPA